MKLFKTLITRVLSSLKILGLRPRISKLDKNTAVLVLNITKQQYSYLRLVEIYVSAVVRLYLFAYLVFSSIP